MKDKRKIQPVLTKEIKSVISTAEPDADRIWRTVLGKDAPPQAKKEDQCTN